MTAFALWPDPYRAAAEADPDSAGSWQPPEQMRPVGSLAEGTRFVYRGAGYEVMWGPISGGKRWGADKVRYWCCALADGREGFAVFDADEEVQVV